MAQARVAPAILSVMNLSRSFGSQPVLEGVSFTVHEGDRIGLIGRNGCGKSTMMKIIAGYDKPEGGRVSPRQGLRIAMLTQDCQLDRSLTVGQVLEQAALSVRELVQEYRLLNEKLEHSRGEGREHDELVNAIADMQHELEVADAWNLEKDVRQIQDALNLPASERTLDTLSGGELRRVDLASTLIRHPDLLLLDEPTNHIDVDSVQWIENFLAGYSGSCILVTHDRYFLDRSVNRIVELERGNLLTFPGNYSRFLELKAAREEHENRAVANRASLLRRELEWMRRGPKARATKEKARISRYHSIAEEHANVHTTKEILFHIPQAKRLGKVILEAQKIAFKIDDRFLFRDFSFLMQEDMRVGILGPNGCGKTTLLKILMGLQEPERGRLIIGENTQYLYIDQVHKDIRPDESILEYVSNGVKEMDINGRRVHVPAWLETFLFDRSVVDMAIGRLSGGERNRIEMAKKLLRGGNFLILDEPTNDIDLTTLRLLEEAILDFTGCALIVSHDRYFLNRVCTHLLVFEGTEIVLVTGNYEDYQLYCSRRGQAGGPPALASVSTNAAAKNAEPSKPRKLTYKERKELDGISDAIHAAEARSERLQHEASDPALYQKDYKAAQEVLERLEIVKKEIELLYARWEELEAIANATT